jgi:membrane associated rhomboid family serine protease
LTNEDEHLSSHHTEIRPILVLLLLAKLCIAYYVYTEYDKSTRAHAKKDYPLFVLLFALLSSSFNSLIMFVHYSLISSNGYSPVIFHVLGSVAQMAAQVALGILLLLLS